MERGQSTAQDPGRNTYASVCSTVYWALTTVTRRWDCTLLLLQVLVQGVHINDRHYFFIGSSQGQLRERTAVLHNCASPQEAWELLQSWGKFGNIKNVAKLYKRVALLFSGSPVRTCA